MVEAQIEASRQLTVEESIQKLAAEGGGSVADIQGAIDSGLITPESVVAQASTPTTLLSQETAALRGATAYGASDPTLSYLQQQSAQRAASYGVTAKELTAAGFPEAAKIQSWAERNPMTTGFLSGAGTTAMSVAGGYVLHQLTAEDPLVRPAGLAREGASAFDPIRVYAAERGIADSDIYKYFPFGNTPEAGNMPLFQQQTIGAPA